MASFEEKWNRILNKSNKSDKEEAPSGASSRASDIMGKFRNQSEADREKAKIGMDTLADDYARTMGKVSGAMTSWQSPSTMRGIKDDVLSMSSRMNSYNNYNKLTDTKEGKQARKERVLGSPLGRSDNLLTAGLDADISNRNSVRSISNSLWSLGKDIDDVSSYYSQWDTKESYDTYNKYNGRTMSYKEVKDEFDSPKATDSDREYLRNYTGYGSVADFDLAISKFGDPSGILESGRNKFDLDNRFERFKGVMNAPDYEAGALPNTSVDDLKYGYINGGKEGAFRVLDKRDLSNEDRRTSEIMIGDFARYDYMTNDERGVYNYLYSKDPKKAADYLEQMEVALDRRKTLTMEEDTRNTAREQSVFGNVLGSIASMPGKIVGGIAAGADVIDNLLVGKEINPYSSSSTLNNYVNTYRGEVGEQLAETFPDGTILGENSAKFLYDTLVSVGESTTGVLAANLTGGLDIYGLAMGLGALADTARELKEDGASERQIAVGSALTGLAEGVFERLSLEMLIKAPSPSSKKQILKGVLRQMITEGSEEVFTEIADTIIDVLNRGGMSEYEQNVRNFMNEGKSEDEARKMAAQIVAKKVGLAGIGGAISGGLMGGFESTIKYNSYKRDGAEIRDNTSAEIISDVAKSLPENFESKQFADKVPANKLTDAELGYLAEQMQIDSSNEIRNARSSKASLEEKLGAVADKRKVYNALGYKKVTKENLDDFLTDVTTKTSEGFSEIAEAETRDVDYRRLARDYNSIFEAGLTESDIDISEQKGILTDKQALQAYKAGVAARQTENAARLEQISKREAENLQTIEKYFNEDIVALGKVTAPKPIKKRLDNLTPSQKENYNLVSKFANAFGANVRFFASKADAEGNFDIQNGGYDSATNTIYIDINSGFNSLVEVKNGSSTMLQVFAHELTHWSEQKAPALYNDLSNLVLDTLSKEQGISRFELVNREMANLNRAYRSNGIDKTVTEDVAMAEIVARACEGMLSDENVAREYLAKMEANQRKTFVIKVRDMVERLYKAIREIASRYVAGSKEANTMRSIEEAYKKQIDIWTSMLDEAVRYNEAAKNKATQTLEEQGIEVNDETDSASLSVRFLLGGKQMTKVIKALAERFGLTEEEARKWIAAETSMASLILNPKYSQYLDYEADPDEVAIKKNSDYPQGTVDFSDICAKRREFTEVMNSVLRNFPTHVFQATDLAKIRTIMQQEGMNVPCGICYVEDRRQLDTIVAQDFIKGLEAYRKGSLIRPDGKEFNPNQIKGLQMTKGDSYVPTTYELVTLEGRNKLKAEHPGIANGWVRYNNARGMQSVRLLTNEAEYKRQILKYSKKTVASKNSKGGLRIYSFSDAEMFHLIDIVQVITDCAAVGLKIQGYTKVNEYAKAVRFTGEKLNRSLIPKGKYGYHMEGDKVVLDYDTKEGIDINSKDFFDNKDNDNIGNITIGVSDTQIRAAMLSDFVDQIIPFHTGQSNEVLGEKGIATWKNYKDTQTEKNITDGKTSKHQVNIYTEVLNVLEKEGKEINKRSFVEKFLEVCKENDLVPRFSEFLAKDANGNFIYTEGYHKLLVDFKTFAQTEVGEYLPQNVVKPVFDNEYITSILKAYVKSEQVKDAKLAKSMPKVVERITNEIIGQSVSYSLRDSEGKELTEQQLDFFKDSKVRDDEGNLLVMYHGSVSAEKFSVFELDAKGLVNGRVFGDGFYFTPDKKAAKRWSNGIGKIYKTYLNITNPYYASADDSIPTNVLEYLKNKNGEIYDKLKAEMGEKWWGSKMSRAEYVEEESTRLFKNAEDALAWMGDNKTDILKSFGYDGIIYKDSKNNYPLNGGEQYVVFDSNQIKNVTNKKPTESEDIRYSLRDTTPLELASEYVDIAMTFDTYNAMDDAEGYDNLADAVDGLANDISNGNVSDIISSLEDIIDDDEYDFDDVQERAKKLLEKLNSIVGRKPTTVDDMKFSVRVKDGKKIASLNKEIEEGKYYVTYKSMSFWGYDEDGNAILRSPMAEYVGGELSDTYLIRSDGGIDWYKATEDIDEATGVPKGLLAEIDKDDKDKYPKEDIKTVGNRVFVVAYKHKDAIADTWNNCYFLLNKRVEDGVKKNGEPKYKDSPVPARYAPFEHSSNLMLNDQFESAWRRANLVTVKMYVPYSEDNGATKVKYAKDDSGWTEWHSGIVASAIRKQKPSFDRQVFLSMYAAPVEIVPDIEVAKAYKTYVKGTDIKVPDNVVSPNLLEALKKVGVPIKETGKVKFKATNDFGLNEAQSQYSLRNTDSAYRLTGESEKLKKQNERLLNEVKLIKSRLALEKKLTKGMVLKDDAVNKAAKDLISKATLVYDYKELATELKSLYSKMFDKDALDDGSFSMAVAELANKLAKNVRVESSYDASYDDLLKYIRTTRFKVDSTQYNEAVAAFGGEKELKKALRGKIKVSLDEGTSLDGVWSSELANNYSWLFSAEENSASQLVALINAYNDLRELKNTVETRYDVEADKWLQEEIFNQVWQLPAFKSTADKWNEKLAKEQAKGAAAIESQKLADDIYYGKKLEDLRLEHSRQMNEIRAERRESLKKQKTADDIYYGRILSNIREQRDLKLSEAKEYGRKRLSDLRERQDKNAEIKKITKKANTLRDWLVTNSKDKHVLEFLKGDIANFLTALDFSSKRLLEEGTPTLKDISLAKSFEDLARFVRKNDARTTLEGEFSNLGYLDMPYDYANTLDDLSKKLNEIAIKYGDNEMILNEMSLEELKDLNRAVTILKNVVTTTNKLFTVMRYRSVKEAGISSMYELNSLGDKGKTPGSLSNFMTWTETLPYYAFQRFGDGGKAIFEALQDGWDKYAFEIKQIIDFANDTYTSKQVKEWKKNVIPFAFESEDGKDIEFKMTTAQLMSLYCLSKRAQARGHLLGGGIHIADIREGKLNLSQGDDIQLTNGLLEEMLKKLTSEQKAVADKLQEFMNTVSADWLDEVSMIRYGIKPEKEANYFPIESNENNLSTESKPSTGSELFRLLNMDFTKATVKNANNAIMIRSIFEVFTTHTTDMAKYNSLALPVLDAYKWFSYKEKDDTGKTVSLKGLLEKAYGDEAKNYIIQFMKDLNGSKSAGRDEEFLKGFLGKYKVASVAFNLRVALLQPTAFVRSLVILDHADLTSAFKHKPQSDKAAKYSGIALWKDLGFFDINVQRSVQQLVEHDSTISDKIADAGLWLAGEGDRVTWGYIWNACEHNISKSNPGLKGEEFNKAVAKKFREVIYASQVVDSTMTRTQAMRNKGRFWQLATSFMSEPSVGLNMLTNALNQYKDAVRRGNKSKAWQSTKKLVIRSTYAYAATALANALAEALMDAWRATGGEDADKDFAEKYTDKFWQNLIDDLSILAKIPIAKDIRDVFKVGDFETYLASSIRNGNEITADGLIEQYSKMLQNVFGNPRMDMAWTEYIRKSLLTVMRAFDGKDLNVYSTAYQFLQTLSYLSGIPMAPAFRELATVWDNTVGDVYPSQKLKSLTFKLRDKKK